MSFDPTRTASQHDGSAEQVLDRGVTIVHHPAHRFLGSSCPVVAGEDLVLGRSGGAFAPHTFEDDRVSRRHASITLEGTQLRLRDLGSHNGTYLNGRRVDDAPLSLGDVVGIGKVLLVVTQLGPRSTASRSRLLGQSQGLRRALDLVSQVAQRDTTVLVLGESGVGKELIAREIHEASGRGGKLVVVNCAAMADGVISSELFGHVSGAFSSAETPRAGLVAQARAGTLFLDEIGDASASLQASLLRLLQEREARPVGADQTVQVDARFVAATNRPLARDVRAGQFREDLYARLSRCVVHVPPLRERREDILTLARHFAREALGEQPRFSHQLAAALVRHDWPGNVRSLQSTVDRLAHEASVEQTLGLPSWLDDELAQHARRDTDAELLDPVHDADDDAPAMRPRTRVSASQLRELLRDQDGNITAVARDLDVARNTVYRWIKKLEIDLDDLRH